jgi:hypothetical protein
MDAEVRRVPGLGATLITDQAVLEDGWRWHILAGPDSNEFCVLQPPASASRRPEHDAPGAA